jgi:hypothetical protein
MTCLFEVCVIVAQVSGGGTYIEKTPTTSVDTANITHNISHFYEVDNQQFNVDGYLILDTNTRVDIGYDNGLKSQKRARSRALTIGITQLAFIDDDSHITFGISTKLGGKTTEVACTDDSGMDKQFFCDNLATLQPFSQPEYSRNTKVSINYEYKFNWPFGAKIGEIYKY